MLYRQADSLYDPCRGCPCGKGKASGLWLSAKCAAQEEVHFTNCHLTVIVLTKCHIEVLEVPRNPIAVDAIEAGRLPITQAQNICINICTICRQQLGSKKLDQQGVLVPCQDSVGEAQHHKHTSYMAGTLSKTQ